MKRDLKSTLISGGIFILILITILIKTPTIDIYISQNIHFLQGSFDNFFIFLGNYLKDILIAIALISIGVLYIRKRKKESFILASSLLLGFILEKIIKLIVQRARPPIQLVTETDYSFPSGHSIFSIILFLLLIYFYKDKIRNKTIKIIFIIVNIFLILLVGFSRIYLNVHWFTDVIEGYVLGFFVISLILFLFKYKIKS